MKNRNALRGKTDSSSLFGCAILAVMVAIVIAVLFPVIARPTGCSKKSNCESNLKQIGASVKMYLTDWQDHYPTNRPVYGSSKVGKISDEVRLTPPAEFVVKGKANNLSWVEALYKYMEPPTDNNGTVDCGAWECKSASTDCYPGDSKTAYTTYAMNRNLIERPEGCVRASDRTLLVRELDRHANSVLRPTNYSCGLPNARPQSPFLTEDDSRIGYTQGKLHSEGSHILFTDGHVKWYPLSSTNHVIRWNARKKQWILPTTEYLGRIAITP